MKIHIRTLASLCLSGLFGLSPLLGQGKVVGDKTRIDADWDFLLVAAPDSLSHVLESQGWRHLSLPHDWSVETEAARIAKGAVVGPFSSNAAGTTQTGWTVGGEGWYRKNLQFTAPELSGGRKILYLEGAYNQSEVYVNGKHLYFNPYGYSSFRVDITNALHPGENEVVVKVSNHGNNSRWYAGSGIYRHVWLITKPDVGLKEWDTFIHTDGNQVTVDTSLDNAGTRKDGAHVKITLFDPVGKQVGAYSGKYSIPAEGQSAVNADFKVDSPVLWSPDSPNLYTARIEATSGKGDKDVIEKKFGFRTLEYNATEGFRLNGVPTLIKGGCVHHDHGLLGAASYDDAEIRKVKLLKERGYNALRTSHGIPSEAFLNVCDSLGMMVLDECFDQWYLEKNRDDYHNYFPEYHTRDLETMVRRDRNHPSIIMWGFGNEIPGRIEPRGMAVAEEMRQTVRALDPTRPVTAAISGWDVGDEWNAQGHSWDSQDAKAFESLDVGGYNYLFKHYEHDHGTHPDRVICGLESYPKEFAQNWQLVEKQPYVIGDFVWTAMDYLGEAGIGSSSIRKEGWQSMFQPWPWFNGWCGDVDLTGQQKPQSLVHDVVWGIRPIAMNVQRPLEQGEYQSVSAWGWPVEETSWTYPQYCETDTMTVRVFSRVPKVMLSINGRNLGEAAPDSLWVATFRVPYEAGSLTAFNLDSRGAPIANESFQLKTTGAPVALRVTADREFLDASDPQSLAYITIEAIDKDGCVVNTDDLKIDIKLDGDGAELLASGTASPTDMQSFRSATPRLYHGRALAILRSTGQEGETRISASAPFVTKGALSIPSK